MRLIVCGGRGYCDQDRVDEVLDGVYMAQKPGTPFWVITGGASGADECASQWCASRKNTVHNLIFYADWHQYGKAAGPMRNQRMLSENPDLVIAFPGGHGTWDMVRRAEKAGVPVRKIDWEESQQRVEIAGAVKRAAELNLKLKVSVTGRVQEGERVIDHGSWTVNGVPVEYAQQDDHMQRIERAYQVRMREIAVWGTPQSKQLIRELQAELDRAKAQRGVELRQMQPKQFGAGGQP